MNALALLPFVVNPDVDQVEIFGEMVQRGSQTPEEVIRHNIVRFERGNNHAPILLGQVDGTPCYLRLSDGLVPSQVDFKLYPEMDTHYYSVRRNGSYYDLYRHEYRKPSHDELVEWIDILIAEMGTPVSVEIPASGYRIETEHLPRSRAPVDFIHMSEKHGKLRIQGTFNRSFWVMSA